MTGKRDMQKRLDLLDLRSIPYARDFSRAVHQRHTASSAGVGFASRANVLRLRARAATETIRIAPGAVDTDL